MYAGHTHTQTHISCSTNQVYAFGLPPAYTVHQRMSSVSRPINGDMRHNVLMTGGRIFASIKYVDTRQESRNVVAFSFYARVNSLAM